MTPSDILGQVCGREAEGAAALAVAHGAADAVKVAMIARAGHVAGERRSARKVPPVKMS